MTKLLGVIGDPIAHSLSPVIHNGWLRDMGFNATYEAMHVRDGEFENALKTLEKRDCLGVNVTLPHKAAALAAASEVSEAAKRIAAANTLTPFGRWSMARRQHRRAGIHRSVGRTRPGHGSGGHSRRRWICPCNRTRIVRARSNTENPQSNGLKGRGARQRTRRFRHQNPRISISIKNISNLQQSSLIRRAWVIKATCSICRRALIVCSSTSRMARFRSRS